MVIFEAFSEEWVPEPGAKAPTALVHPMGTKFDRHSRLDVYGGPIDLGIVGGNVGKWEKFRMI